MISAIHEKDDLLDSQEDFLIKENKKHVKVKNAYALEVEKCEKLSSELSTCHETINNLRDENARLIAKVDSHICNASIPNLRNDNDDLLAKIKELNDSLATSVIHHFLRLFPISRNQILDISLTIHIDSLFDITN